MAMEKQGNRMVSMSQKNYGILNVPVL